MATPADWPLPSGIVTFLFADIDESTGMQALTLEGLANIAWRQGDRLVAMTAFKEALVIWRVDNDCARMTGALANLGAVVESRGDFDRAVQMQEEALAIARELAAPLRVALILNNLATAVWNTGDVARAPALLEESAAIKRREGSLFGLASSPSNLGMLAAEAGDRGQRLICAGNAISMSCHADRRVSLSEAKDLASRNAHFPRAGMLRTSA